jgi:D-alanyl-D-alanine carboxypeptidase
MNDLAKNLGLSHTYFLNVSGLDLSTTQAGAYGSAHDVARLFGYAASTSPNMFEQTARNKISIRATTGETVTALNTDEALASFPGLIVGKTGYTDLAEGK